jgi:ABC-2 type transport system ATP-binding protein
MFVEVNNVWKKYPGVWALKGISFVVEKGKVLGVLGPNGAGKSTLFRIIATVTRSSKGSVIIGGVKAGLETRKITAFLPEVNPFYNWMKVMEQMEFLSVFYEGWDIAKTRELLRFLDLEENVKIGTLSKGQQAKLKIVLAFSWPAKLVLMDEPLGGIDPPTRKKIVRTFFNEFRVDEQTILMSTHLVNEVEEFVENVIFLRDGEIVLSGAADTLREQKGVSLEGMFDEIVV